MDLTSRVPVKNPETGVVEWFGPGDPLPDWVNEESVPNPAAWQATPDPVDTPLGPVNYDDTVWQELAQSVVDLGYELPEHASKDALSAILRNHESGITPPVVADAEVTEDGADEEEELDYETWSKDDLFTYGEANGVHVTKSMTKAELIEAIEAS